MSVSEELLCSFELLKPLDSSALKSHIKKGRNKRNSMLNSPVSPPWPFFPWQALDPAKTMMANNFHLQPAVVSAQSY